MSENNTSGTSIAHTAENIQSLKEAGRCIAILKDGRLCGTKAKDGTEYCGRHPGGQPVKRAPRGSRQQVEAPAQMAAALVRSTERRGVCAWCGSDLGEDEVRLQHGGHTHYFDSASCAAMHLLLEEPEAYEGIVANIQPYIRV